MNGRSLIFETIILIFFASCHPEERLPILGNAPVTSFHFVNQDSLVITNSTFDGKVYIADFFFTSCTTICPGMHQAMKGIFEKYKKNPEVMFLSHTIDFKYDKPDKLKKYAIKLGVDCQKWQFAYGSKEQIYRIAEESYLAAVIEDSTVKDNFVHQGYLLLVDRHRRLRGAYDSANPEQVALLKKDIDRLLME